MQYETASQADHACAYCKQRKRKCDKIIPSCSMCTRKSLICDYDNVNPSSKQLSTPQLGTPHSQGSLDHLSPRYEAPKFPAVFFLDSKLFQKGQLEIPRAESPIPQYAFDLLGQFSGWRSIASEFFDSTNTFMPIISKARLYGHYLNPLIQPRANVALLVLCMRLVAIVPPPGMVMPAVPEYLAAKALYNQIETAEGFSLLVLQSGVLLALYEFGHAIYPAAYLSIGTCARYGISGGLDGTGIQQLKPPFDMMEGEERKRVWWAVLILDHAVNLGNPTRALVTQEPNPSSILPIDDESWDKGELKSNETFTLCSPASLRMGRFARFAQAVYLLGRVFKHVSDHTASIGFLEEEKIQLRRTLEALVRIIEIEGESRRLEFCTQTSICYSGLLILRESCGSLPKHEAFSAEFCPPGTTISETVSKAIARMSKAYLSQPGPLQVKGISPFVLHIFYETRALCSETYRETGIEEFGKDAETLADIIGVVSTKWRVGEAYMEILKARELTYLN